MQENTPRHSNRTATKGGAPSFRALCGGWVANISTSRSVNPRKDGECRIDDAVFRRFQHICSVLVSASFIGFLKARITLKSRFGLMAQAEKRVFGQSDTRQNLAGPG